jgi:hypothetical protein
MLAADVEKFFADQIATGKHLPVRAMHKELLRQRAEGLLPAKAKRRTSSGRGA